MGWMKTLATPSPVKALRSVASGLARAGSPDQFGGLTISTVTKIFFRPELITDPIMKAQQREISRFLYFVMRDARQSIRNRKNPSKPGKSPTNRKGLLKDNIFYGMESYQRGVSGPVPLDGPIRNLQIPRVLEGGGQLPNKDRHGDPIISSIAPRPYMAPALERQKAKRLPMTFEGCLQSRF